MITIKAGFRSATPQVSHRLHRRFQSFSEIIGIHGWHKFKLGTKPYEQRFGYDSAMTGISAESLVSRKISAHRTPSSATK